MNYIYKPSILKVLKLQIFISFNQERIYIYVDMYMWKKISEILIKNDSLVFQTKYKKIMKNIVFCKAHAAYLSWDYRSRRFSD